MPTRTEAPKASLMDLHAIVTSLVERVAKLEAAHPRRRVYNQHDAASEVGLSVKKFREEMKAGRIRGTLNGRRWLFTDEELERYVKGAPRPPKK
jgi:hypothetical protein